MNKKDLITIYTLKEDIKNLIDILKNMYNKLDNMEKIIDEK